MKTEFLMIRLSSGEKKELIRQASVKERTLTAHIIKTLKLDKGQ